MAVSEIDKHRRRWEENPKGLTFAPYADALRKAGEAEQALDVLRAGLEFHPDYIPANIVLGRCHLDLGDDVGAEGAFERVLSLDPENVIALKALADVNERAGRWSAATRWLEMLLSIDRGNDAAREQMERVQLGAVQAAAAEAATSGALDAEPVAPEEPAAAPAAEVVPEPVATYEDAIALDPPTSEIDLGFSPATDAAEATPTFESFQPASVSPDETAIVAPVVDADEIVLEDRHLAEAEFDTAADRTANEFAVEDAAASFSADTPDDAPSWSTIGKGEYVPSIFADDSNETTADDTVIEPMGGLELERTEEPIFTAPDVAPLMVASAYSDASTIDDDVAIDGFAPTTEFDAVAEAGSAPVASILDGASVQEDAIDLDGAVELGSMPQLSDEVVADAEAPHPAPEPVPVPVPVPSPVSMLALEPADVASLDASARAAATEALAARAAVAPVDVLAAAPAPDPAVLLALAASATAALAMDADADRGDAPSWGAWQWGDTDPDLVQLAVADEPVVQLEPVPVPVAAVPIEPVPADDAEFVEAVLPFDDAVVSEPAPHAVPMEAELDEVAAPATAVQVEAPADEIEAVPPGFAAPVLVTAAMAALYEGQGHLLEALATYRELEARTPGVHGDKIASLEARVRLVSMPAPPVFAARISGGQPVHEFFGALLRTMPAALAPAAPAPEEDGPALRRAAEPMSLGRLFGEEPTSASRPRAVAARTASIDEFYGAAAPAAEASGRDDLEQFHSWLQGLKT